MQEVVRGDANPPPPVLTSEHYVFLGDVDLPAERYTSRDFFEREMERIWPRTWQWACREEHIPEPGDSYVYEVGPFSILIVRQRDGSIRAFVNSCLHRGTKLRPCEGEGAFERSALSFASWKTAS